MRRASILCRTLAAARGGSASSFIVVPNRFLQAAGSSTVVPNRFLQATRYGSTTATSFTVVPNRVRQATTPSHFLQATRYTFTLNRLCCYILGAITTGGYLCYAAYLNSVIAPFIPEVPPHTLPYDVILYQYEHCPKSSEVKAILDYCDIPYKVVEVSPISMKEVRWSEDQTMPILMLHGEQLNGSSAIIDKLGEKILSKEKADSTFKDEETKWRQWVENHLEDVLNNNKVQTISDVREFVDYMLNNGNFNFLEKIAMKFAVNAIALFCWCKTEIEKSNVTDERATLYEAAEMWVNALNGKEFLGGSNPNFADLSMFGIIRTIRFLRSGKDMMEHTCIGEWYTRMESVVGESSRIKD